MAWQEAQQNIAYYRWPTSLLIVTLTDPETPPRERVKIRVIIDQRIPIPDGDSNPVDEK